MDKTIICIPARYGSSRFEGKPLAELYDKPMIQHVYDRCMQVKNADQVYVLTDDNRIADCVREFNGNVIITSAYHTSGTDRIGEALSTMDSVRYVINVQGDEPLIESTLIEELICTLKQREADIITACNKIENANDLFDFNVVKVVRDLKLNALYFSRQAIPAQRDEAYAKWYDKSDYYRHIGIYGFKAEVLHQVVSHPPTSLELIESLEQLRWLQMGYTIKCFTTPYQSIGVDTPEDLERINALFIKRALKETGAFGNN